MKELGKAADKCYRAKFNEAYDEEGHLCGYWRLEPVLYVSINLTAEYTGRDRATVAKRARRAYLYPFDGPKDAKLYRSDHLFEAVFRRE
jgi:hypothetical protein